MKYFCVSDVHGFYDELISALNAQGFDRNNPNHALVVCGDVFDRGSQPREMFNFLSSLDPDRFVFIRGNHEDLLFDCVAELQTRGQCDNHHFSNGTVRTLTDLADIGPYDFIMPSGINAMVAAANPVMDWINRVSVNYFEVGNYIFVHGWVPIKRKHFPIGAMHLTQIGQTLVGRMVWASGMAISLSQAKLLSVVTGTPHLVMQLSQRSTPKSSLARVHQSSPNYSAHLCARASSLLMVVPHIRG